MKSKYAIRMSLMRVYAFSIQRLRCVMDLEHEFLVRKPYCSRMAILWDCA